MGDDSALLLGCGPVGIAAARLLGKDRAFGKVITVDALLERAASAAEACGDGAVPLAMDCTDEDSMARVLSDVSLVVNTVPLPLALLLPLIRGVVEAGASYTDACVEPESLQAVFDSEYLHSLAGHRAVSVVPGMGAAPGLTNALTSYLGQRLERLEQARFCWVDDLRRRSRRQWMDRLTACGAPAMVWRDGNWQQVAAMTECEDTIFPPPLGIVPAFTVNLGEATLPYSFASLTDVSSHRGFSDPAMAEVMKNLCLYGFASDLPVETAAGPVSPVEFAASLFSGCQGPFQDPWDAASRSYSFARIPQAGAWSAPVQRQVEVGGVLRGRKTQFKMSYYFPEENEAEGIAASLAVGARMLLTRELPSPGVHPPESLDPAPFLWNMERRGVEIQLTKTIEE